MSETQLPEGPGRRRLLPNSLLKRLLFFILVVLLLPGIGIPLSTLPYLQQSSKTAKLKESMDQASQQARMLESVMTTRAVELLVISQLPEMRRWLDAGHPTARQTERDSLIRALQSYLFRNREKISAILLTDLDGVQQLRVEASAAAEPDVTPRPHAHLPYVTGALQLSAIQSQNLPIHLSQPDPDGPLYFSTLIRSSQGKIAGVVAMEILPASFLDTLRTGGPGELCQVLDKDGQALMPPVGSDCAEVLAPVLPQILRTPAGHVKDAGEESGFFYVHARARPQGQAAIQWTLVYRVPLAQIEAPFRTALRRIGLLSAAALLLALLLALQFSRRLTLPLRRLAEAADDMCHGYWNTELPRIHYRDEIGELTDSFASMSRQLRSAQNELLRKIQELEASKASLADEKERLLVTLRSIGDGVIVTDLQGVIHTVNPAAAALLGASAADLPGRPFSEAVPIRSQTLDEPLGDLIPLLKKRSPLDLDRLELRLQTAGGDIPVQLTARPICNPDSEISGMVAVLRDLRALVQLQAEKTRAEKLQSLGVLAGGIAHDFNNLLSVIMGDLSLLLSHNPEGSDRQQLSHALEASRRARDLTTRLMTFAKGGVPVKEITDLGRLIEDTVSFALHGSACRFHLDLGKDLWGCRVDTGQMHQVFHNLAINAVHAMPRGGCLDIRAENTTLAEENGAGLPPGPCLRIEVRDEGCGIRPEDLPSIFDPYFTTKANGNGLGLSSVYSILRAHGGTVSVDSSPSGTRFVLLLPADPGATAAETAAAAGPSPAAVPVRGRILLLDDDENICLTAGRLLRHLGHEVDTVQSAEEAIRRFETTPYDLVILDLTLPGGFGGAEVLEKLRQIKPSVRALVSSGYSNDPVMANCESYGFRGRIAKPYTVEELNKRVEEALA